MLAVVLAAGLMATGCGGTSGTQKTALSAAPAAVVAAAPAVSGNAEELAGAPVLGTTYQMEAMFSHDWLRITPGGTDISSLNLGFTYYWKPVNNDDTPVGLQEFMQKATKAGVKLWFISPDVGSDETAWEIAGNYGIMDNKLIAEAALNGKFGLGDMVLAGNDWFGIRLGAKYYILDTLTAGLAYSCSRDSEADTTVDQVIISSEYAVQLGGRWLDSGLTIYRYITPGGTTTTIGLDFTYYILKELGVNVMYARTGGDDEADTFGIGAKYYYGPFGFGLAYRQISIDPNPDISDFGLTVEFRF